MKRDITIRAIEDRIKASKPGTVYITADFIDIASSDAANRALQRLNEAGIIRRIHFFRCGFRNTVNSRHIFTDAGFSFGITENIGKIVFTIGRNCCLIWI